MDPSDGGGYELSGRILGLYENPQEILAPANFGSRRGARRASRFGPGFSCRAFHLHDLLSLVNEAHAAACEPVSTPIS